MAIRNLDGGYTSGLRVETFGETAMRTTPIDALMESFTTAGISEPCRPENTDALGVRSWFIAQEIYTPMDIGIAEPQPDDRPWAGVLYAGRSWEGVGWQGNALSTRRIELGVGVVGDASLARQSQQQIHRITGSQHPRGWGNQINNRVAAALRVLERRRWGNEHADLTAHAGGMLGTLQGYVHAGATLRYGRFGCEIASPGVVSHTLRVVSADGCGQDANAARYFGFVGVDAKAVGWDDLIDGEPRRGVSNVHAKHQAGELRAGFSYGRGRWTLTYMIAWRSAEFSAPGRSNSKSKNYAGITLTIN